MIVACWVAAMVASVFYGGVLAVSTDAARATAPLFVAVTLAAWLILTIHHWRHR